MDNKPHLRESNKSEGIPSAIENIVFEASEDKLDLLVQELSQASKILDSLDKWTVKIVQNNSNHVLLDYTIIIVFFDFFGRLDVRCVLHRYFVVLEATLLVLEIEVEVKY